MCHRHSKNHKINHLYKRCLRIIYCDKNSTFEELLDKGGSVTISKWNLQILAIEMFKVAENSAPWLIQIKVCLKNQINFVISSHKVLMCPKEILSEKATLGGRRKQTENMGVGLLYLELGFSCVVILVWVWISYRCYVISLLRHN